LAWRFVASPIICILTVYLSHQLQSAVYTHLSGRRSYNYCLILSSGTQNDRARLFLCTSVSLLCFSSCTQFYLLLQTGVGADGAPISPDVSQIISGVLFYPEVVICY
jgi:hypothetical protein